MSSEKKEEKKQPSRLVKTLGAMVGGVIEACALQPLDVIKTRLQLSPPGTTFVNLVRGMFSEGVLSFYKGLSPFVCHLVLKYSVRWYFNEFYRGLLADKDGKVTTFGGFLAGTGSGITEAVLIVTPFEVIKTRLQQQKGLDKSQLKYQGMVHAAKTIAQEEGVVALWKGNIPTMLRQGVNQLFLFGSYDYLKKSVYGLEREAPISSYQSLVLGIIAGALGPLFNNPIDVAKTRLMAQITKPGEQPKYRGTIDCILKVGREEGGRALMRGCTMRILRVAPGSLVAHCELADVLGMGITFTTVEKFSEAFG